MGRASAEGVFIHTVHPFPEKNEEQTKDKVMPMFVDEAMTRGPIASGRALRTSWIGRCSSLDHSGKDW